MKTDDASLEYQTRLAFRAWRADQSTPLEMRCKDGSDAWGPCVINDDCWWRHSYYRIAPVAEKPAKLVPKPLTLQAAEIISAP